MHLLDGARWFSMLSLECLYIPPNYVGVSFQWPGGTVLLSYASSQAAQG